MLDDVDYVTEIDHIGGNEGLLGREDRVPSASLDPEMVEVAEIAAASASVVEDRPAGSDDAVQQRDGNGTRREAPRHGGASSRHHRFVGGDRNSIHVAKLLALGRQSDPPLALLCLPLPGSGCPATRD